VKTYKNLYPKICTWENLESAYRKARKGKRRKQPVADFEYAWESQLLRLQEELMGKTYRPGPYHSFYIHEPKNLTPTPTGWVRARAVPWLVAPILPGVTGMCYHATSGNTFPQSTTPFSMLFWPGTSPVPRRYGSSNRFWPVALACYRIPCKRLPGGRLAGVMKCNTGRI
jgi:hypothetical protein